MKQKPKRPVRLEPFVSPLQWTDFTHQPPPPSHNCLLSHLLWRHPVAVSPNWHLTPALLTPTTLPCFTLTPHHPSSPLVTAACCLTVEEEVVEEVEVAPEAPPEPEPEPEPEVEPEPEPEPEAEPEFEGMWIGLGKGCFVILSQATAKRATNPDPQCADAKASHANATFPPFIAELCFCSCETTEVETR